MVESPAHDRTTPPGGSWETCANAWAHRYVTTCDLATKLEPGRPPRIAVGESTSRRIVTPGRPPELRVIGKAKRSLQSAQLRTPRYRGQILHTFFHHELQAAELMCWATMAFADTPRAFRAGLLRICCDEIRHMNLYRAEIERLGFRIGAFPVRDWIWQRVTSCRTPVQFVALMGLGFEGGNLDHSARYVEAFADAGDLDAARTQELVGREEIGHVRFAARWFARWTGGLDFDRWVRELPPPLSPRLLHGRVLDRDARASAGLPTAFIDSLAAT